MPRPRALSAVIMCSRNTPSNGPLMVVPGSHKKFVACMGRQLEANWETSLSEQQYYGTPDLPTIRALASDGGYHVVTGEPGDVFLFDCNLLHGSAGNISHEPRCNAFVVLNAVSNALRQPYNAEGARPEHVATRNEP